MPISARAYQEPEDFQRVRDLLSETQSLNWTRHNWSLRGWDRWRYQRDDLDSFPVDSIRLWETSSGELVGVAHAAQAGQVAAQVHPDYRHIEPEMFIWAEVALATAAPVGQRTLETWVFEYDELREMLLAQHRYRRQRAHRHTRWRSLQSPVQAPYLPKGYRLRRMEPTPEDAASLADLLATCTDEALSAAAVQNFQLSPGYRANLDMVIEDEETGDLVAHCASTMDETNQFAQLSTPCTHPDHRLKGLARGVLFEVLRRLRQYGVQRAYVSCGDDRLTNKLYEKVGFRDFHREHLWRKEF